ncbi:MAG TPA: GNAT family N-acetyltransferase [Ktedonobacterales bacterium]|jgi:GNAT superfamily N-acetyltransferase
MDLIIRPVTEDDAAAAATLLNLGASEPITAEQMRDRLRQPADQFRARLVATDTAGRIVAYGQTARNAWNEPGLFWVHVAVAPDRRRQGIGSRLYGAIHDALLARGATVLRGEARDHFPESLAFAEHLGFRVERHIFESTLALVGFDERPFAAALDTPHAAGIRFLTLAEAGDTLDARRTLHALDQRAAGDVPGGSEASTRPFDAYLREVCEAPSFRADCQFIAANDADASAPWIGLASLDYLPGGHAMYNGLTGVLPAYRGRGIAQALKLLTIRAAVRYGVDYIRTNNDSLNAPMLAINRKFGYQPEPGYARMRRELGATAG